MLILSLQSLLQNPNLETKLVCIVVLYFPHNNIAGYHLYDECKRSNASSVLSQDFVHFVTARASLFADQKIWSPNTSEIQTFQNFFFDGGMFHEPTDLLLDCLFDRITLVPKIQICCIDTKRHQTPTRRHVD